MNLRSRPLCNGTCLAVGRGGRCVPTNRLKATPQLRREDLKLLRKWCHVAILRVSSATSIGRCKEAAHGGGEDHVCE
eukprot:CAMPEP_0170634260 /NCGR_PEP_ID=MMETSP0224-20130122/36495_1 /TAXON_ID=285029 /ORGANISM="Togula jolla, Strain CCCM 725" /LENGTH=76 /DNA_ID=CAMNT_0010963485 /DNA_START=140 /DNA_END=367 /DNA_ORIENTATION=-